MIVVDTSVLVNFLKGNRTASAERLTRIEIDNTPYFIPAICCQELLQGAKDENEWDLLFIHLSSQRLLYPRDPWDTHVGAARIYFDCRRIGITIRSTIDCLIAQMALDCEGSLLHDDEDFEMIKQVRDLKTVR